MSSITNISNGPFAAGSTIVYTGVIQDASGNPVSGQQLVTLTLSLVETDTGLVLNNVDQVNILNQDRGTVDNLGNLTITLSPADTAMTSDLQVNLYSLIIDFSYNGGTGRHQVNFKVQQLSGS